MKEPKKLKHQAPRGYRPKYFTYVGIDGDLSYCASHNFMYNHEEQKKLLYEGKPCYYTDNRFYDGNGNFYKKAYLIHGRRYEYSFKSCMRMVNRCAGIPKGTIVEFSVPYYYPNKKFSPRYLHKVKKEVPMNHEFEINSKVYFNNFQSCNFSKELTNRLRSEGFIVAVYEDNENYLSSMFSTAASYAGKEVEVIKEVGQVAVAYGHGKKIGFSSHNNTVFGYSNGCDNILFDRFNEFDKWSTCGEIPKTKSIDEIVEYLKDRTEDE